MCHLETFCIVNWTTITCDPIVDKWNAQSHHGQKGKRKYGFRIELNWMCICIRRDLDELETGACSIDNDKCAKFWIQSICLSFPRCFGISNWINRQLRRFECIGHVGCVCTAFKLSDHWIDSTNSAAAANTRRTFQNREECRTESPTIKYTVSPHSVQLRFCVRWFKEIFPFRSAHTNTTHTLTRRQSIVCVRCASEFYTFVFIMRRLDEHEVLRFSKPSNVSLHESISLSFARSHVSLSGTHFAGIRHILYATQRKNSATQKINRTETSRVLVCVSVRWVVCLCARVSECGIHARRRQENNNNNSSDDDERTLRTVAYSRMYSYTRSECHNTET